MDDRREKRNVDSGDDPDNKEAAGGEFIGSLDYLQPTVHGTFVDGDEDYLNIQLTPQRMKVMHELETLQIKKKARTLATGRMEEVRLDIILQDTERTASKCNLRLVQFSISY